MKLLRCRFDVSLPGGGAIRIRPVGPWARRHLLEGLARTSAETQTRRFGAPRAGFSAAELDFLTRIDGRTRMALGALDMGTGRGAGVARWVREGADMAEAAILVVDEFARRGVGKWLFGGLIVAAKRAGLKRLRGESHVDNHAMLALARSFGASDRYAGGGRTELSIDLPGAWPDDSAGRFLACIERHLEARA
ncbi:MAG: N-acetyltransferase family protein [Tagaea sp.]